MSTFNVWGYLARMGVEVRGPGHNSVEEGDHVAGVNTPIILRIEDLEELLHRDFKQFSCQVPNCGQKFSQLHESETHYNAVHRHSCSVCKKALPSPHLLELHIQENHDSFFSVLSERSPSYQCFLPSCSETFWGAQERHAHAIKDHKFPPDFRFDQVKRREKKGRNGGGAGKKKNEMQVDNDEEGLEKRDESGKTSEPNNQINHKEESKSHSAQVAKRRPLSLARMGDSSTAHKRSSMVSLSSIASTPSSQQLATNIWNSALDVSRSEKVNSSPVSLSAQHSGKKSRIPVMRSSSCRVPKNLSFGAGVQRTFVRPKSKHWHQTSEPMDTGVDLEKVEFDSLRAALPD